MKRSRNLIRLAPAVAALALVAAACELGEPPHRIEVGHVDGVAVAVEGGELDVHIHDDSGPDPVERDPAATVLHARPDSMTQVPANPAFSFLGPVGSDVWILPQVQNPDLLWLGWETTDIGPGVLQGNNLTWKLNAVVGPGAVQVFTNGPFGSPNVIFNSANGLPDSTVVATGAHVHANWAFGAAGQYNLVFEVTATLANGTPVTSGNVSYTVTVGSHSCADIDDATIPASASGGATVNIGYLLTNCGTDAESSAVQAVVTAPAACGGATTTFGLGSHTLDPAEAQAGSGSFTAPVCAGTYTVKVRANGPVNSYVQQANLQVS